MLLPRAARGREGERAALPENLRLMEFVRAAGALAALLLAALGIVGGLLTLPEQVRAFRRRRWPRGYRGTGWVVLGQTEHELDFLVAEDIFHFIRTWLALGKAEVRRLELLGSYVRVTLYYPNGAPREYKVVQGEKPPARS